MPPLFSLTTAGYYRARTAIITADVTIGPESSIWFGAVIRGDVAPIRIGRRVNVQDNAVVHCDNGIPNEIEDEVTIGHGAIVHGAFVGRGSLVGMGSTLLGGSRIGRGCLVAAGAVVSPGLEVPDGMVVMGVPGKVVRPLKPREVEYLAWLNPHYVALAERYARGEITETP
jgi:carbonic anhydrase/acetyltransferase-like protein (isoleucine patch superfamily)